MKQFISLENRLMFEVLFEFRWKLFLASITTILTATLFGTGIGLLLPTLHLLLQQQQNLSTMLLEILEKPEIPPVIYAWGVEFIDLLPNGKLESFFLVMTVIGLVGIGSSFFRYLNLVLVADVVIGSIGIWRSRLFNHVIRLPMIRFLKTDSADLLSRIISDTAALSDGYQGILGKAPIHLARGIAALLVAMLMDWRLTLMAVFGAIPLGLLMWLIKRRIRHSSKRVLQQSARLLAFGQNPLLRIGTLKHSQAEVFEQNQFQRENQEFIRRILELRKVKAFGPPVVEAVTTVGLVLLASLAGWFILDFAVEPARFLTLIVGLAGASQSLRILVKIQQGWSQNSVVLERLVEILEYPLEDSKDSAAKNLAELKNEIAFEQVSFTYPKRIRPAVDKIGFTVKHGQIVVLVGSNGAGKSTVIHLLTRLLEPDSGTIRIDGHNIQEFNLSSLRGQIAVVPQEPVLFEATVHQNIAYGKPGTSRDKVLESAKKSMAHRFIVDLPQGYDTVLSTQGRGLSVGQKQRIALARALVRDPSILILDEPTSHLDSGSEEEILRVLDRLRGRSTILVIAHHLKTISGADLIIVMDKGRVVETGNHDRLIKTCPIYQELWDFEQISVPRTNSVQLL